MSTPGDRSATAKGEVTRLQLTRLQQLVSRRTAEARATAPELVLQTEIAMDAAAAHLEETAGRDVDGPTVLDLVVKACGSALREFPRANAAYRDGGFELYSRVNVGITLAGRDAQIVPTIYDVDAKSLADIARESRALAGRAEIDALTPPELSGGTFTISDLGRQGIERFTAILNPPQAAILAVGAVTERAVVRDGGLAIGRIMDVTLSCDHRILYGAEAAGFLAHVREKLEQPAAWLAAAEPDVQSKPLPAR